MKSSEEQWRRNNDWFLLGLIVKCNIQTVESVLCSLSN